MGNGSLFFVASLSPVELLVVIRRRAVLPELTDKTLKFASLYVILILNRKQSY